MNSNFVKWFLIIIAVLSIVSVVVVAGFYFSHFDGGISGKQEIWGSFGDFIGGSLNPILSFMGLIALLFTIFQQNRELELTRDELKRTSDANEKQASHFEAQQRCEDLFRVINKLYERINDNYNNKIFRDISLQETMHRPCDNKNVQLVAIKKDSAQEGSHARLIISYLSKDLHFLIEKLDEYDGVSERTSGRTPLKEFYKREYADLVHCLTTMGLLDPKLAEFYSDWPSQKKP